MCSSDLDAFGPFRVLHQIGAGTLGPVFRAYDPERDRLVAVKLFRLGLTPELVHQFTAGLERLVAQARDALAGLAGAAATGAHLAEAVADLDLDHPSAGVAILASPGYRAVYLLTTEPTATLTVGPRFALAALVASESGGARTRVLVCSRGATRCIEIGAGVARERLDDSFPVVVDAPTEADTPHRDFPLDEHESDRKSTRLNSSH